MTTSTPSASSAGCHDRIMPGEARRHRRQVDQPAQIRAPRSMPPPPLSERQEEAFQEELPLDAARRRAERLADADLARPLLAPRSA